jgi:hypothetical protein
MAGKVAEVNTGREPAAQSLQGRHLVQRLDGGTIAAVGMLGDGIGADHHQPPERFRPQRQQPLVVLEQHDGVPGNLQGGLLMAAEIAGAGLPPLPPRGQQADGGHHPQEAPHLVIHQGFRQAAVLDGLQEWPGQVYCFRLKF